MSSPISLEDVLNIKYLGKWDWSPDGRFIAYIWDDGGVKDLWIVEPGVQEPRKLTCAKKGVSDFAWSPRTSDLYFIQDKSLFRIHVTSSDLSPELIYESKAELTGLSWSPHGTTLAFGREGKVWLFNAKDSSLKELNLPGHVIGTPEFGIVVWSPSGKKFAFSFKDNETYRQVGVAKPDGSILWRSYFDSSSENLCWFDEDTLYFARPKNYGTSADLMLLSLSGQKPQLRLLRRLEGNGRGPTLSTKALPSPDKSKVLFLLEDDRWAHYYILDGQEQSFKQVTFGHCEDFGHAGDSPCWWPDSASFIYSTNEDSRGERHIFRHYLDSGTDQKIIDLPGTNSMGKISPRGKIAFVHCDEFRNMDLWVAGADGKDPVQLTFSMLAAWTSENQFVPEEVSFKSAENFTIYGYLMKPKNIPPGKKLPGLVWVHGGPIRQMRPGWHPLRSYALFHAFNQYLVHKGYVILSVNYRGGIGYGRDFRNALYHKMGVDDVADVVNAGKFLKSLPYVDADNVGVWGLSYGGYMTLHSLTQYPDVFKAGVNIAGIWDFPQWTKWAERRYGKKMGLFKAYLGGEPETSPELYRQASPKTFVKNMKAPLLNVQGTADRNVDFQQMDSIIKDCVEHGRYHEVIYYPGEVHTFANKKSWLDAMPKIEAFLDRNLKGISN